MNRVKKVVSIILVICSLMSVIGTVTVSASSESMFQKNYNKLFSAIKSKGKADKDGNYKINYSEKEDDATLYFSMKKKASTLILTLDGPYSEDGMTMDSLMTVTIDPKSKKFKMALAVNITYDGVKDSLKSSTSVEKSKYKGVNKFAFKKKSKFIDAKTFNDLFNTFAESIFEYMDLKIYNIAGFGFKGLGFVSYPGKKSKAKCSSANHVYISTKSGKCAVCGYAKTGLVKIKGSWYYFKKGVLNKSNTLVKYNKKLYHIKKGKWNPKEGVTFVKYKGKYYYCKGGKANLKFTGKVKYKGKKYKVVKGIRK